MKDRREMLEQLREALVGRATPWQALPDGCTVEIEERDEGPVLLINPMWSPFATKREPEIDIVIGRVIVLRLTLSALSMMNRCLGWNTGTIQGAVIAELFRGLEQWAWKLWEAQRALPPVSAGLLPGIK